MIGVSMDSNHTNISLWIQSPCQMMIGVSNHRNKTPWYLVSITIPTKRKNSIPRVYRKPLGISEISTKKTFGLWLRLRGPVDACWYTHDKYGCQPKNRGILPPKWMVKIMENPIKVGWFGGPPLFLETSIYLECATCPNVNSNYVF